jgi:hypothetical protein
MQTRCAGFSKTGTGYPVSGTGYLAPGTWYPAPEPVRRRGPNTEHRRPSPATGKRAHRVCRIETARIRITWYLALVTWMPAGFMEVRPWGLSGKVSGG